MTALDALLPGPRQRPDATAKAASPDTPGREAPAEAATAFGRELGRLERPQGRGQKAAEEAAEDATVTDRPAEPGISAPVVDPQAALRALIGAAQEPAISIVQPQPAPSATPLAAPTAQATPAGTDLVALAERAASSTTLPAALPAALPTALPAILPAERPKVAVLGQETHFAPVVPGQPLAAEAVPKALPPVAPVAQPVVQVAQPVVQVAQPMAPVAQPVVQVTEASVMAPPAPVAIASPPVVPRAVAASTTPVGTAQTAPAQIPAVTTGPRPARPAAPSVPREDTPVEATRPGADAPARPTVVAQPVTPVPDKPAGEDTSRREPGAGTPDGVPVEAPVATAPQPGLPATTLRQLAQAIVAEAPASAPAAQPAKLGQAQEGPLRLLTIQLQPADLGTVTVRMRLQEGRLEIGMETGRHETADLLRRDGGALTDLLRGAGYQADLVTIRTGGSDLSGAQTGTGQGNGQPSPQQGSGQGATAQNQPQGQQGQQNRNQTGFADGGASGGSNPGSAERRPTPRAESTRSREGGHEAHPVESDRSGLYL